MRSGAIIIAIVGAIWGLLMLIGGIISLIKQLNLGRQGGGPLREREASEPLDVAKPDAGERDGLALLDELHGAPARRESHVSRSVVSAS